VATLALAFPLLSGKSTELHTFAQDLLGRRQAEFAASQRRIGVTQEHWFHQVTPAGDLIVVVLEAADPAAALAGIAGSQDPFDVWQKARILDISGVDMNQPPAGPLPEHVLAWPAE
jgi:hypothetical protein